METPEQFHVASHLGWQFFVTLTFKSAVPPERTQMSMLIAFFRQTAALGNVHFRRLLWVARLEAGEIGGRLHYHVLIDGLPLAFKTTKTSFAIKTLWEKIGGGHARCREYDRSLPGVDYVLKGLDNTAAGANAYEVSKFGGLSKVIYSNSFLLDAIKRR